MDQVDEPGPERPERLTDLGSRDVSKDLDPAETQEWIDALDSVLA